MAGHRTTQDKTGRAPWLAIDKNRPKPKAFAKRPEGRIGVARRPGGIQVPSFRMHQFQRVRKSIMDRTTPIEGALKTDSRMGSIGQRVKKSASGFRLGRQEERNPNRKERMNEKEISPEGKHPRQRIHASTSIAAQSPPNRLTPKIPVASSNAFEQLVQSMA